MARQAGTNRAERMNPALAGLAAWAVPGLGHWLLGHRARAVILFAAIMITYWIGVWAGGVRFTVDPAGNTLWFIAQMGIGPQVIALWLAVGRSAVPAIPWPDSDIAIIYAGIAGLLNMLVILDAIGRASGDEPVEARETSAAKEGVS